MGQRSHRFGRVVPLLGVLGGLAVLAVRRSEARREPIAAAPTPPAPRPAPEPLSFEPEPVIEVEPVIETAPLIEPEPVLETEPLAEPEATESAVAAEPVIAEPVIAEPVAAQPVAAEPVMAEPVMVEPEVALPEEPTDGQLAEAAELNWAAEARVSDFVEPVFKMPAEDPDGSFFDDVLQPPSNRGGQRKRRR